MFPSPHTHAQLQPLEPVQPAHAFPIHEPPFATQQHPDPEIPEPRSGLREIAHPQP